jgi:lipid-A-disaccharide synthase
MKKLKVYLIAGEASGDLLGSRLMRAMKKQMKNQVVFYGVGGEAMEKEGLKSLFDISVLSVMGIMEVVPSIPKILGHINDILKDIKAKKPDIVMTIDSFSFSARVHQRLKKDGYKIPHVHCVAPQVWAWKKGRAKTVGNYIDHLFCLLPNEADYFTPHGAKATFIGHPVVEGGANKGNAAAFRKKYKIPATSVVLSLLPGSRRNEIKYLLPTFMQSAEELKKQVKDLFVVIPTVHAVADTLKEKLKGWSVPHAVVEGEKERYDAFAASQIGLAASGTVSLELAMAGVPHLIAYKVSPVTAFIVKRLLKVRYVNLLNILADKEIIPELIQDNCTVDKVVLGLETLLKNKKQSVAPCLKKLGLGQKLSPSERMAQLVREIAERQKNGS